MHQQIRVAFRSSTILFAVVWLLAANDAGADSAKKPLLTLYGERVRVHVETDLRLTAVYTPHKSKWSTSPTMTPVLEVRKQSDLQSETVALAEAHSQRIAPYDDGQYRGSCFTLSEYPGIDVSLELVVALAKDDKLLIQIHQASGADRLVSVNKLYQFETPLTPGAYMVIPRGCGYLLDADHPDVTDEEMIGLKYTMPIFGLVQDRSSLMVLVDTYWDAQAAVAHLPQSKRTGFGINWLPSLGELRYARRLLVRLSDGDYVGMAKAYRQRLHAQGLIRTLGQKAQNTPKLKRYIEGVEYRWTVWKDDHKEAVLRDLRELNERRIPVNFFFPKWQGLGVPGDFSEPGPVTPNGWEDVVALAQAAHDMGFPIKVFFGG